MTSIAPGDYYEDCAYHPCLCISVDADDICGISLVDGSYPRSCSIEHCGVRQLTLEEVLVWKQRGPQPAPESWTPLPDKQWWWPRPSEGINPGGYVHHLFESSLLFLRNHAEGLLGKPIVGWYASSGSFSEDAREPFAHAQYAVKGSLARATVQVDAIKEGRLWPIQKISLLIDGAETAIVFDGDQVRGCGHTNE